VHGLTADDFLVYEDDSPVEVVNFYYAADGRWMGDTRSDAERRVDAIAPGAGATAIPESQRLHLILYVDNYHIHPLNRNRAFSRLRQFVKRTMKPGDEAMVATYDRSLHMRQPFTDSADRIGFTLLEVEEVTGYGAQRERDRQTAVQKIYESRNLHQALWEAKQFADVAQQAAVESLRGMREMISSLGGLPGRKMLVHVSDGLPMVPGQDLYQAVQQHFVDISALGEAVSRDLSRDYLNLVTAANTAGVSLYTIDSGGLRTKTGMSAENPTVNSAVAVSSAVDSVRARNLQDTLLMLADRTGGQAIINTNDIEEGLARFALDIDNYYSLGYRAPVRDEPGRYHRIEVELVDKRRGWHLRHREGYRDRPIGEQIADATNAHLVHGYESNPLGVEIELGAQQPSDDEGMVDVEIIVHVPMSELVFLPRPGFHEAQVRFYFGATDPEGATAELAEIPFELRIPDESIERARQDRLSRSIGATMRPGPHRVVVAVRDEIGQERSVVGRYVSVERPRRPRG
jgi:VWFA-related protein